MRPAVLNVCNCVTIHQFKANDSEINNIHYVLKKYQKTLKLTT